MKMTTTLNPDIKSAATDLAIAFTAMPNAGPWRRPPHQGENADAYLSRLVEAGHHDDAVRFTAARLEPRLAVWWGALSVWSVLRSGDPATTASDAAAIDAAVTWVLEPNEENRRSANAASVLAGMKTAAGALATAAFWSEGSVSLPGQPDVPPPAGVCQKLVANAVLMAHGANRPLIAALRLGAEVLAGANRWPENDPATNGAHS